MQYDEQELQQKALAYIHSERTEAFRAEVRLSLERKDWADLYDRFSTSLSFGTAGMRGLIGGGTNRINTFMVEKVTQGLARYLQENNKKNSVVIAYDSRHYSKEFALSAALVLSANNIQALLFDTLHPVPLLSFSIRYLQASAGIVITASHNPSVYNGYKVYYSDGGQVTPPHDVGIAARANAVTAEDIRRLDEHKARDSRMLLSVPSAVDDAYYHMVFSSLRRPSLFLDSPVTVAYTPLHGTGNIPVRHMLHQIGVRCVVVSEQELPDGDFPTVKLPNPESPEAMTMVLALARKERADIVLGTDPDADRLGIAIPTDAEKSEYRLLTGNQIAALLCEYLITTAKELHTESRTPVVVKSLVTTDLVRRITEANGGVCRDVLTGFKYIAEQMSVLEGTEGKDRYFLFGCEESYGFLCVNQVRDKDAVSSAVTAVEMLCYYARNGITGMQKLDEIYDKYGYSTEIVFSRDFKGAAGKNEMRAVMEDKRKLKKGDMLAGKKIGSVVDLLQPGSGFPQSDVLVIYLESGEKVVVRPSGTEPKIKL
ncbi:MAG: phospho-sugar mutase [Sphaerochaetaceae bacterium]